MAARKKKTTVPVVTEDVSIAASRQKLKKAASPFDGIVEQIESGELQLETVEDYEQIIPLLEQVCELREKIYDEKEFFYRPAKKAADRLAARFKGLDSAPRKIEEWIRRKGGELVSKRYREALTEHAARARLARERGNEALATQLMAMVEVQECVPEIKGIGFQRRTTFSIEDEKLIPREFMKPDEEKIGALVKALGYAAEEKFAGAIKVQQRAVMTRKNNKFHKRVRR